jgi:imidazolonepropionase-like amidohydrolase
MRRTFTFLIIILLPTLTVAQANQAAQNRPVVFRHVTLIDMTNEQPKPNMTVIVSGNRIAGIGKNIKVPKNAQIIDASGKFLIPGLWDMHVHTLRKGRPPIFFPLFIANGVTSVRDMGSSLEELDQLKELRQNIANGTIIGPRIAASAGPLLDGPNAFWPGSWSVRVSNETDARQAVDLLKQHGADFIKTYNNIPREAYFAIIDEAKKQGLPVAGHVPLTISALEASNAGQKTMEHLGSVYGGILLACSSRETEIRKAIVYAIEQPNSTAPSQFAVQRAELPLLLNSYSEEKAKILFSRFVQNGTWQVPTLAVLRAFAYIDDPVFTNDERVKYLPLSMRSDWKPQDNPIFRERTATDIANGKRLFNKQLQLVGEMNRAGVPIMAGSDTINPYVFPGFSLQDELGLLVQAGLTPLETLQAATINPAKFLGKEKELGTIEKDKLADLILLEANPLEDISNTRKINAVIFNGRLLDRKTLDKMLADVEITTNRK